MADYTSERTFQDEIVSHLTQNGWLVSNGEGYDQETALYTEDVIGFVQETQPDAWEKLCKHYPQDPEKALIRAVTNQVWG